MVVCTVRDECEQSAALACAYRASACAAPAGRPARHSALYASVRGFQRMHGPAGLEFAAYIPFYAACNIKFRGDGDVSDRPIRIHHGLADDFVPIAPCRLYVARLRAANKDVVLTEYPNAHHAFDNPGNPEPRQASAKPPLDMNREMMKKYRPAAEKPDCPLWVADSTDRRNTLAKSFGWGCIV